MITEFTFVRHGESMANLNGIAQGQADSPLSENGEAQAKAVANYLKDTSFDVIISSDLTRAMQTAEAIRQYHADIPYVTTRNLREWDIGTIGGMKWDDIRRNSPEYVDIFLHDRDELTFPSGESRKEFSARIISLLEDLRCQYAGKKLLLISHGGVLQQIFRYICSPVGNGNVVPLSGNASISGFAYMDNLSGWQLLEWNNRSHLRHIVQHQTINL